MYQGSKRRSESKPGTVIVPFSAVTKQGREEIWQIMDEAVGYEE